MSQQRSDEKPASEPMPETQSKQPSSTELSAKELDRVAGGIQITRHIDKASPKLFLG